MEHDKPPIDYDKANRAAGRDLRLVSPEPAESKSGIQFFTSDQIVDSDELDWAVHEVMPKKGIAAVYGQSGTGKSFLVMDMCAAIATGRPWFGRDVEKTGIAYFVLEGSGGLPRRLKAMHSAMDDELPKNFLFSANPVDLRLDAMTVCNAIREQEHEIGVVVIDTLNQSAPGIDENSSKEMGDIRSAIGKIQSELDCLVILVHHAGKDSDKGMRGHSSLFAAMDAVVKVSSEATGKAWHIEKSKDGLSGERIPFELEIVKVGEDKKGRPVTSCVISKGEESNGKIPARSDQRALMRIVREYIDQYGHQGKGMAPAGHKAVEIANLVEVVMEKHVQGITNKKRNAERSIDRLIKSQCLRVYENWIWMV